VADADPADVDVAVTAARAAFDEEFWPKMSGRERARILHKAAGLVRASAEEIVRPESLDVGKPVSLCLPVDVLTTAEQYEYYPALAQPVDGATRQIPVNAHACTRREPLGVQRSPCLPARGRTQDPDLNRQCRDRYKAEAHA
jgi:acyl-CoA reductase-like NAD-dependent aldehyde dehydrogenase